jgi:hypothetical protein
VLSVQITGLSFFKLTPPSVANMVFGMAQVKTVRVNLGLEMTTLDAIDQIAQSFEDDVSRGEVVDLLAAYAAEDDSGFPEWLAETFSDQDDLPSDQGAEEEDQDEGGEES